jgi:hypothetical protein
VRRLRSSIGVIPRGFPDGRTREARRYRAYCVAMQEQFGPLPAIALPTLREAGRCQCELERLAEELQAPRARRRLRDARRIRRDQFALREQLQRLERRLDEFGATRKANPLAGVRAAIKEANRR